MIGIVPTLNERDSCVILSGGDVFKIPEEIKLAKPKAPLI